MSESHDDLLPRRIGAELRLPVRVDPSFDDRVMAAVRVAPRPGARVLPLLLRPRTISVSPLTGLAAAAVFAGLIALGTLSLLPNGGVPLARQATGDVRDTEVKVVQFVLVAPSATSVALVGDFNDWDAQATPLRPAAAEGMWTVSVPLAPGRHHYSFVVDGSQWTPDPLSPRAPAEDDFGMPNSVITVAGSST